AHPQGEVAMRTPTFWRWGVLSLTCLALLTAWAQIGRPQPAPNGVAPPLSDDKVRTPSPAVSSAPIPPPDIDLPNVTPMPAPAPTPAPPPTVEDLIKQLEHVRKQQADLEAQEKALVAKLRDRFKDQENRLRDLRVLPIQVGGQPAPAAPRDEKDNRDDA